MTFQQNQPSIVILSNKLQDDRASRSLSDLSKHVPQAEIEYENMCRKLEVAGNVKQIEAIGEMVSSLRNGQIKCAKTHAPRVQQAMQLYQKTLLRVADEVGANNRTYHTNLTHRLVIIIKIITLFLEYNIFGTNTRLIFGPHFTKIDMVLR